MKRILFLILFVACTASVKTQSLERKGSLGAEIGFNADSTGVLIKRVLPGSTAEAIGVQAGFVLLSVNGTKVKTPSELIDITSTWRAGDDIVIDLVKYETFAIAEGKVIAKPKETSSHGAVMYGEVEFDNNLLRSILITPTAVENPPVLFYVQGYGCASQDYYHSPHPVKSFIEDMVSKGIAVFRMEKPGMGDSSGDLDCDEIGYHKEVDAFTAGLQALKNNELVDTSNVFLFGHSLGGITAPQLAARIPVAGMVNYGSVSTSWYEYLIKMMREQSLIFDMDYEEIQHRVRERAPIVHAYLVEKQSLETLQANPDFKGHLYSGLPHIDESGKVLFRHYDFMPEINSVDITSELKNAATYTLALQGEFDIAAIDEEWAKYEADVVNAYHPGKGEWQIVKNAEHGLATIESRDQQMALRESGEFNLAYMAEHYQNSIGDIVFEWIQKVMKLSM